MDWKNKYKRAGYRFFTLLLFLAISRVVYAQGVIEKDSLHIESQYDTVIISKTHDVIIWPEWEEESASEILTDSLLRWTPLRSLDWVLKNRPGVRLYSTGTLERQTAIYTLTSEPRHIRLSSEGVDLRDPITGQIDLQRLSSRKLRSLTQNQYGAGVEWKATYREHYLNEPRLYLYFDENGSNIRDLEVLYTHNILKNLNVELGYHDLRDGLNFYGMNVTSGLIHARTYWQISPHLRVKAGLNTRKREAEESFGYTDESLFSFSFNPLIVRPLQREEGRFDSFDGFIRLERDRKRSSQSQSDVRHEGEGDEGKNRQSYPLSRFSLGVYVQSSDMRLETFTDSLDAGFDRVELHTAYLWQGVKGSGGIALRNRLEQALGQSLKGKTYEGMEWTQDPVWSSIIEGNLSYDLVENLTFYSRFTGQIRSDERQSGDILLGMNWTLWDRLNLDFFGGISRLLPDWQSLYWSSTGYSGNPDLLNEESKVAGLRIQREFFGWLHAHSHLEIRRSLNTPYTDQSGSFVTAGPIETFAGMISLRADRPSVEGGIQAWFKQALDVAEDDYSLWLDAMGSQTMVQAELFVKGPIYKQAAYTKAGMIARFVPSNERGPAFNPLLNRWQLGADSRIIPAYGVVDLHISTRLRWMMIYLQLENALNGLGQNGYFETPGYPMSGRRFIFGIHVLFKN